MKLREANENDEKELLEIYQEYINSKTIPGIRIFEGVRDFENLGKMNFQQWLTDLENNKYEENLPKDYSTHTFYLIENDEDRIVGAIGLRWKEVPVLMKYGGFIGYSIRPTERGKGYATEMLRLILPICHQFGEGQVLLTCDKENEASRKTIIKSGGILENEIASPPGSGENRIVQRYWIAVSHGGTSEL